MRSAASDRLQLLYFSSLLTSFFFCIQIVCVCNQMLTEQKNRDVNVYAKDVCRVCRELDLRPSNQSWPMKSFDALSCTRHTLSCRHTDHDNQITRGHCNRFFIKASELD